MAQLSDDCFAFGGPMLSVDEAVGIITSKVIAVDRSEVVLTRARALARRRRVSNVIWKKGELEKLPMRDASVDVAMLSQALHHAQHPARAVAEAARITAPGGRVLVLDLRAHQEDWVRAKLGDRPRTPDIIRTVRPIGYMFVGFPPPAAPQAVPAPAVQ